MDLNSDLTCLKGIGDKTKKSFEKLGVYTVGDILLHFPRTYFIYPELTEEKDLAKKIGEKVAIKCILRTDAYLKKARNLDLVLAQGFMEHISIDFVWFRTPYIRSKLYTLTPTIFFGKLVEEKGRFKIEQPEVYQPQEYINISKMPYPIYPLTRGVGNKLIIKTVDEALSNVLLKEYMPDEIIAKNDLLKRNDAISIIHRPATMEQLIKARERLAYDEIFKFLLAVEYSNKNIAKIPNDYNISDYSEVENVIQNLPFQLTDGQINALSDIKKDFGSEFINQRLIQGDVGCGKTIVAFLAMLSCVTSSYQAALMAPTEVLAAQHAIDFKGFIEEYGLDYEVVLLTGSLKTKERKEAYAKIESGEADFIIGTQALIQEAVTYHNLALVVIDEQHRFGVKQREALSNKGINPFTIVMSATPIPRTLSMIIYCGMDVSLIKDVPKTKLPIKNCAVKGNKRLASYKHILKEVEQGHQAYIICPLVEASEVTEAENVKDYYDKLKEYIPDDVTVGLLHGKMKPAEKNKVMEDFVARKTDILISTTVVEVGVNNPNATVIMIENASRFGLAQLHQLRGRVGRGKAQSYCIFMDSSEGNDIQKRLKVMVESNDGFYIANKDLELRGPGDIMGIRQSGEMNFRIADIYNDANLFIQAKADIEHLLENDYQFEDFELFMSKENIL